MTRPPSARPLHAFLRRTDGAITTEFVIIFPLVILLIFFVIFVSLLISTASDVQQIAHELSRASLSYLTGSSPPADVCEVLRSDVLPRLIEASVLVASDSLTLPSCAGQPDASGFVTITVTYDFVGSYVEWLGANFNLDVGLISRVSTIRL